jgi:subtilisin family serine protease
VKRSIVILLVLTILLPSIAVQAESPATGRYLVLLKGNGVSAGFSEGVTALGGRVDFAHDVGIAIVSGLTEAAAKKLGRNVGVVDVKPDVGFEFAPIMLSDAPVAVDVAPQSSDDPTTAARYSWQWNMRAISADEAWAAGRFGSSDVTVAILDTGIDYMYPDLDGRVDLGRSVSFVPEDDALVDANFPERHHITDLHFHGTHVAATVASNSLAAAGVTTQTTLMGVKVCSYALGVCPSSSVLQGVLYAVDNGADVINMSLGGYFLKREYGWYVGFLNKVFNYANRSGVTVVVSAGNDAEDLDHDRDSYKTYCNTPNTICVAATGPTGADDVYEGPWYDVDAPAFYTNFGRSAINVAAPGGTLDGWVWAGCSTTSLEIPGCQAGYYVLGVIGTSQAAPHVSGLAALLVEDVGRDPGLVKARIQQSADDVGKPGVDPFYGKGRINVANAVVH